MRKIIGDMLNWLFVGCLISFGVLAILLLGIAIASLAN